jgi:hypothetical protein
VLSLPVLLIRAVSHVAQLYPSGADLDSVRERHVHAPDTRVADRIAGDHVCRRVGGHGEGGRPCRGQARRPPASTGEANRVR